MCLLVILTLKKHFLGAFMIQIILGVVQPLADNEFNRGPTEEESYVIHTSISPMDKSSRHQIIFRTSFSARNQ